VLLVEDEPALRMLVQRTLTKHGYDVVVAGDVAQARQLWHREPAFDMVLSDIVLPGEETGIDLVQSLRALQPSLKVLFMTGYTAEMDKPNFPERVRAPVLGKPFDIATLLASVAAVMGAR
jgi:DNA-binding response OmpR family regulator